MIVEFPAQRQKSGPAKTVPALGRVLAIIENYAQLDQPSLDAGLVDRAEPHGRAGKFGIEFPRPVKTADQDPLD